MYASGSYLHVQNTDYARRRIKRVRLHGFYVSSVGTMFTIMNDTQLYLLFPLAEEVNNNVLSNPSN